MNKRWRCVGRQGLLILLVVAWACSPAPEQELVLAVYEGGEISEGDYRTWLEVTGAEHDPDRVLDVVTTVAAQKALADAAVARGVHDQPAMRLALEGLENRLLETALRQRARRALEVDDDEVSRWLEENDERLGKPKRVRLSNIFKRFQGAAPDQLFSEMAEIRRRLEDGADWAEMALRESDSQTRFRQGSIGLVKPGTLDPEVEEVAFSLEPGEISPVIETQDGLTLLRCDSVEDAVSPNEEEKRQEAARRILQQKEKLLWQQLQSELLATVRLDIEATQLVSTDPETLVVEAEGGRSLTLSQVELLLRQRGVARRLADLPEDRAKKLVESVAMSWQAAERAREQGLDENLDLQARLFWRRALTLGAQELRHRVEERFEPLREDEIRAYFDSHRERFRAPETFRLAAISWRAESAELRRSFEHGQRLSAELTAGAVSFEEAASQHSELPSASRGGLLGWLNLQQVAGLGPHVVKAVKALQPGETSSLVQQPDTLPSTRSTLWIVRLLDRRPSRPMTFDEARREAENLLGNARTRELQNQLEQELVESLDIHLLGEVSER